MRLQTMFRTSTGLGCDYYLKNHPKSKKVLFTLTHELISTLFFLNNQPDALIIQILFCYKTLHVSGNLSAHHQQFSTVHSALISFMQVFDDHFQAESVWNTIHSDSAWIISASGWLFKKKKIVAMLV